LPSCRKKIGYSGELDFNHNAETCTGMLKWLHKLNKRKEKKMDELNFIRREVKIDGENTYLKFDEWVDSVFEVYENPIDDAYLYSPLGKELYEEMEEINF